MSEYIKQRHLHEAQQTLRVLGDIIESCDDRYGLVLEDSDAEIPELEVCLGTVKDFVRQIIREKLRNVTYVEAAALLIEKTFVSPPDDLLEDCDECNSDDDDEELDDISYKEPRDINPLQAEEDADQAKAEVRDLGQPRAGDSFCFTYDPWKIIAAERSGDYSWTIHLKHLNGRKKTIEVANDKLCWNGQDPTWFIK